MERLFDALGRYVVRFRYLVIVAWLAVIVVTSAAFPSLGSEVNNDNSQFLPSTAPSSQAAQLAAPILGNPNTTSEIVVVAARNGARLTPADEAALVREVGALRGVPRVETARILAVSSDGEAAQVLAFVKVNAADITAQKTVVSEVIKTFSQAQAPPGLQLHVAGTIATNVANQQNSAATGNKLQFASFIFIVILLLLVFRSLLAPVVTLLAPAFALLVSSRLIGFLGAHGLKISEITELLLIVLLIGAGTDYGLFLVFRVREEMRAGRDHHEAVRYSLVRVGESISASAGTVIFALLSLLVASFGIYRDLGIPLAIGIAVMLVAGLTLLPALLAVLGRALFWPLRLRVGPPRVGTWGRVAARLVRRPGVTLSLGVVFFGALAAAIIGYHSAGFGGALSAPSGTDAAAGNAIIARHFPQTSTNPANVVFRFDEPLWRSPGPAQKAEASLQASGQFEQFLGPFNPDGTVLTAAEYQTLHQLGPPESLPPAPKGAGRGSSYFAQYEAYRATAAFVSPDGRTVQFDVCAAVTVMFSGSRGIMSRPRRSGSMSSISVGSVGPWKLIRAALISPSSSERSATHGGT